MKESLADLIRRFARDELGAERELVSRLTGPDGQATEAEIVANVGRQDVDWELGLSALVTSRSTSAIPALGEALDAAENEHVRDSIAVTLGQLRDGTRTRAIGERAASAVADGRPHALRLVGALAQVDISWAIDLAVLWFERHPEAIFKKVETAVVPLLNWISAASPDAVASLSAALGRLDDWSPEIWDAILERWRPETQLGGSRPP